MDLGHIDEWKEVYQNATIHSIDDKVYLHMKVIPDLVGLESCDKELVELNSYPEKVNAVSTIVAHNTTEIGGPKIQYEDR